MDEANEGAPVFAKVNFLWQKNDLFENGSIAMHRWWTGAGQHVLGPAGDRAKGEGDRQEVLFWPGMLSYGMICDGMVWYGMTRYDMIWYALLWYDMAWPGMIWSGMLSSGMIDTKTIFRRLCTGRASECGTASISTVSTLILSTDSFDFLKSWKLFP